MISAASIDAAGSVLPETQSGAKNGDTTEKGFLDIFSTVSKECPKETDTKAAAGNGETSKLKPDEEDTDSSVRDVLDQILQLAALIGQYANQADQEVVSSVQETITGVLEGNGVSDDTDIASVLTGLQTCFTQLGSEEKEAILARMPQATTLLQEVNRAATGNLDQIDSIPCPLENFSEPAENPAGSASQSGVQQTTAEQAGNSITAAAAGDAIRVTASATSEANGGEAASNADAIVSQNGTPTQTDTDKNVFKAQDTQTADVGAAAETADENAAAATEETGGEEASADTDVEGDKTQNTRTGETEGASSPDSAETTGTQAAFTADNTPRYTNNDLRTAADNALTKLSDILESYDGTENNRFEIQLEPENLGKLSITLTMGEDGLRAQIRAKDVQIQSLLSSEISTLVEKLSENGVQIKSLDVICADMGGEQLGGQSPGGMFDGQGSGQSRGRHPEDILTAYEETGSNQIYAWADEELLGSTVSYRA